MQRFKQQAQVKSDLGSKIFQVLRLLRPKSDFARALFVLCLLFAAMAAAQPVPTATMGPGTTICAGSFGTLSVTLTGTAPWTLLWSDGFPQTGIPSSPALRQVSPAVQTTYSITTVTDATSASNAGTGSATVFIVALPTATVSGDATISPAGSAIISVALTGSPQWILTWSDGFVQGDIISSPATRLVSPAATTTYTVTDVVDRFVPNTEGLECHNTGTGSATITVSTPSQTFSGMPNTSLGQASLSLDLDNHLVISNIGASGNDGVSFALGQAQFGAVHLAPLNLSPGAFVQVTAIGSLNATLNQPLGSVTFTSATSGVNIQFDLSSVGAFDAFIRIDNGPTQVFLGQVPGNILEVVGAFDCFIPPVRPEGGTGVSASVQLNQKLPITIPGGPTVTGDRIVYFTNNVPIMPDYISEISVTGAGLSQFTLESEALGLFDFPHLAAGSAQLSAANNQLTVSNLGATLLDGVDIEVEEAGVVQPCFLVGLAAVPLSGVNEQVHFAATGFVCEVGLACSASPTSFGAVDLLATGSGFNVNVDYSAIGASMVEVMVFNAGVPVGSAIVPAGTVGTITAASPAPSPSPARSSKPRELWRLA